MKRLTLTLLPALIVALVLGSQLGAQQPEARIALVHSDELIRLHPAGQAGAQLEELAFTEISDLQRQIQTLVNKANTVGFTSEDEELYGVLIASYETVRTRWEADILAAVQPAMEAVNAAIAAVAQENGITMVFDIRSAEETGLVVYAQDGLDITEAVAARLQ